MSRSFDASRLTAISSGAVENVLRYNIMANTGTVDAAAAIQAAHDALPAAGGTIRFPAGLKYRVVGQIVLSKSVHLDFEGGLGSGSVLEVATATGDVFTAEFVYGIAITGLYMRSAVPRISGAYFNLSNCPYTIISHCRIDNSYIAFEIDGGSLTRIKDVFFRNPTSAAISPNGALVWVGRTTLVVDFQMSACLADCDDAFAQPTYGIVLQYADAPILTRNDIIHCGTDLMVRPDDGQVVSSLRANGNFFDTAVNGIVLAPAVGGMVLRNKFYNNWSSSHTVRGVTITGEGQVIGTHFVDHESILNALDNVYQEIGTDTHYRGGVYSGSATGAGLSFADGMSDFYLDGVSAGAYDGTPGNLIGIFIGEGCTNYEITGGRVVGNTSAGIADDSHAGIIRDVTGARTRNRGSNQIDTGETSIVISHGLIYMPEPEDITLSPLSAWGDNAPYVDPTSITSSQFTVRCATAAASDLEFSWTTESLWRHP